MLGADLPFVKGTEGLLEKGLKRLTGISKIVLRKLRDDYGVAGYELPNHLFVAKKEPFRGIISISEWIYEYAKQVDKPVIVYLKGKYYVTTSDLIDWNTEFHNKRGDVLMRNFSLHCLKEIK